MAMVRDDVTAILVRNLQALMAVRGMNAHELAARAGKNPTAVYDILSGKARSPKLETVGRLAGALGVQTARLIQEPTEAELHSDLHDILHRLDQPDQERLLAIAQALLDAHKRD